MRLKAWNVTALILGADQLKSILHSFCNSNNSQLLCINLNKHSLMTLLYEVYSSKRQKFTINIQTEMQKYKINDKHKKATIIHFLNKNTAGLLSSIYTLNV